MKKITLFYFKSFIVFFLLTAHFASAQAPVWEWVKPVNEGLTRLDSDGNIYTAGVLQPNASVSYGAQTLNNGTLNAIYIAKFNDSGTCLWIRKMAEGTATDALSLSQFTFDVDDNILITGEFAATLNFNGAQLTNQTPLQKNLYLAKITLDGTAIWAKKATYNSLIADVRIAEIKADSNGNTYTLGVFDSSEITFDSTTFTRSGERDIFFAKYDINGNVSWIKQIKGRASQNFSIAIDNDDNIFVTASYVSNTIIIGDTTFQSAGNFANSFLAKYHSGGGITWVKNYACGITSLAIDPENKLFVTGDFSNNNLVLGTFTLTNMQPGRSEVFIAKLDTNGEAIWAKKSTGPGSETTTSVITDTNNNVYISGAYFGPYAGFENEVLNSADDQRNIFLAKYSTDGALIWLKGSAGYYNVDSNLILGKNNNLFLGGVTATGVTFGNLTLNSTDIQNFVVKLNQGALGTEHFTKSTHVLYPNPAKNIVNILGEDSNLYFTIGDMTGKIVKQGYLEDKAADIANLPSGIYTFKADGIITKFIKE